MGLKPTSYETMQDPLTTLFYECIYLLTYLLTDLQVTYQT